MCKLFVSIYRYVVLVLCLTTSVTCAFAANRENSSRYQAQSRVTWEAKWDLRSDNVTERERATLWLTVRSNHPISGLFDIEDLQVPGLFSEVSDRPSYSHQTVDGQKWYLSNYRYDVYPSRSGSYTLPELTIKVTQRNNEYQFKSDTYRLEVGTLPREAKGSISSSHYSLSQKTTKTDVMSGGVVTRTITQTASELPGYLIGQLPPLISFDEQVELTHGRDSQSTETFRGEVTGTKSSNLHYRFLEAGNYQLPAMAITWWDNSVGRLETASIAAVDIVVTAPTPPPIKERMAIAWFEVTQQAPIWWYQNQIWVFLMGAMLAALFVLRERLAEQAQRVKKQIVQAKQTSAYFVLSLTFSAIKSQPEWQKAFYHWMRKKNVYSMSCLPKLFLKEIDNYHQSGKLNKVNVLRCVVKWEINLIKNRWNLSDINPN